MKTSEYNNLVVGCFLMGLGLMGYALVISPGEAYLKFGLFGMENLKTVILFSCYFIAFCPFLFPKATREGKGG
jgi:hypothetical protein